nr:unnamed protein product [Callosobruchus chinensis]
MNINKARRYRKCKTGRREGGRGVWSLVSDRELRGYLDILIVAVDAERDNTYGAPAALALAGRDKGVATVAADAADDKDAARALFPKISGRRRRCRAEITRQAGGETWGCRTADFLDDNDVGAFGKFSDSNIFTNSDFWNKLENNLLEIPENKPISRQPEGSDDEYVDDPIDA